MLGLQQTVNDLSDVKFFIGLPVQENVAMVQQIKDRNRQNKLKRHFTKVLLRCHDHILEKVVMKN